MTPQECSEYLRCEKDFTYFAENYLKILHWKKGLIEFRPLSFQKRMVSAFEGNQYVLVPKFRFAGFSTLVMGYFLWKAMFRHDLNFMSNSKTDREAIHLGEMVFCMIDNLPDWLKPALSRRNGHTAEFSHTNCRMWFHTCEAARGKKCDWVFVDEAAFIPNMESHWKAVWPTISCGGNVIVLSTINGLNNWFAKTHIDAVDGKNKFYVCESDYREHPDYTPEWDAEMKANLGNRGFRQEFLQEYPFGRLYKRPWIAGPLAAAHDRAERTMEDLKRSFPRTLACRQSH